MNYNKKYLKYLNGGFTELKPVLEPVPVPVPEPVPEPEPVSLTSIRKVFNKFNSILKSPQKSQMPIIESPQKQQQSPELSLDIIKSSTQSPSNTYPNFDKTNAPDKLNRVPYEHPVINKKYEREPPGVDEKYKREKIKEYNTSQELDVYMGQPQNLQLAQPQPQILQPQNLQLAQPHILQPQILQPHILQPQILQLQPRMQQQQQNENKQIQFQQNLGQYQYQYQYKLPVNNLLKLSKINTDKEIEIEKKYIEQIENEERQKIIAKIKKEKEILIKQIENEERQKIRNKINDEKKRESQRTYPNYSTFKIHHIPAIF
jgi:hypothetical protein